MARITTGKVLAAGMLVGLLDIGAAFLHYYLRTGKSPLPVLSFIASGVWGKEALAGGKVMMLWGLLFHLGIALLFTGLFFWLVRRLPLLSGNWILTGIVYGLVVWCVMNLLVLPLSHAPRLPFTWPGALIGMGILVGCIGLPLSYIALKHRVPAATTLGAGELL